MVLGTRNQRKGSSEGRQDSAGITQPNGANNSIDDAGLKHLEGLSDLKYVSLAGNKGITEGGVETLKQAIPNLAVEHKTRTCSSAPQMALHAGIARHGVGHEERQCRLPEAGEREFSGNDAATVIDPNQHGADDGGTDQRPINHVFGDDQRNPGR